MKQLILLRHAKSSWADDALGDLERPLSDRGERDAPRMGSRLRDRGVRPEQVLSSPATRTLRTAELVVRALGCEPGLIRVDPALYLASPDEVLRMVAAQDDGIRQLLVIGHNPGLTELANRLLPDLALDNLPTAGVLAVDCAAAHWAGLMQAQRRLAYFDYPKKPAD